MQVIDATSFYLHIGMFQLRAGLEEKKGVAALFCLINLQSRYRNLISTT